MKSAPSNSNRANLVLYAAALVLTCVTAGACALAAAQQPAPKAAVAGEAGTPKPAPASATTATTAVQTFETPKSAADALVKAAGDFDQVALVRIFGPDDQDIVFSGEFPQDRKHAVDFAQAAQEKLSVSIDPKTANRAFLLIGNEDWPFPVPLVKKAEKWSFDSKAGREELRNRRIGADELDAIQVCRGYVEAQAVYALQPREGYNVNQYAQRIISTPGTQDGLAWQNSDGSWGGPIGEKIAQAIEQGYDLKSEPYHGYFFKILKGQGPAASLGQLDFVIKGLMIGGFALVAAPAEYGVTGVQTFIVSHDGVVYQKDFGVRSLDEYKKMELFNPDDSWTPVREEDEPTPANTVSDTTSGFLVNPSDKSVFELSRR
jgi:Protein of unknown function (DUF2950)